MAGDTYPDMHNFVILNNHDLLGVLHHGTSITGKEELLGLSIFG
jgi:hypothetical protein